MKRALSGAAGFFLVLAASFGQIGGGLHNPSVSDESFAADIAAEAAARIAGDLAGSNYVDGATNALSKLAAAGETNAVTASGLQDISGPLGQGVTAYGRDELDRDGSEPMTGQLWPYVSHVQDIGRTNAVWQELYLASGKIGGLIYRTLAGEFVRVYSDGTNLIWSLNDGAEVYRVAHTGEVAAVSGRVDTVESWPTGNWSTAYSWGDHGAAGYATGTPLYVESDTLQSVVTRGSSATNMGDLSGNGRRAFGYSEAMGGPLDVSGISATAYGAEQAGQEGFGGIELGEYAYGAQQRGQFDGSAGIGSGAAGGAQYGYVEALCWATNSGKGAIQLLYIAEEKWALTTSDGHASLLLGPGTVSNKYAVVAGDGQESHGDGSITAGGGFYGAADGLTGNASSTIITQGLGQITGPWAGVDNSGGVGVQDILVDPVTGLPTGAVSVAFGSALLPVHLLGDILVDPEGSNLHFEVEIDISPDFASPEHVASSSVSQVSWEYFTGVQFSQVPALGVVSNYQDSDYGCVLYTWTNAAAAQNVYYARYRSYDGTDYSDWRGRRIAK